MSSEPQKQMIKFTALYGAAKYLSQMIGIVTSLALRRFLGPTAMGLWSLLQVIIDYCGYSNLGATKAMTRDYPFLRGKGDHAKADRLKDLILTFSLMVTVMVSLGVLVYLAFHYETLPPEFRGGLLFIAAYLIIQRVYDIYVLLLRSDKQFKLISLWTVIEGLGTCLITFTLVYRFNIYGLYLGTLLLTGSAILFLQKKHPYMFHWLWDRAMLLSELKLGFPLFLQSLLRGFFKSMDKLLVAAFLNLTSLGYYSIAMMMVKYVNSLPLMFAQVYYPFLQEKYGKDEKAGSIQNYLKKPLTFTAYFIPILSGLAVFLCPILVRAFIPQFEPGIPAMKLFLLGAFFSSASRYAVNFLVTIDKYMRLIPIVLFAILVNFTLNITFINLGYGITGVAVGTSIAHMVRCLVCYDQTGRFFKGGREALLKPVLIYAGIWAIIFLVDVTVSLQSYYLSQALKAVVFLILMIPFFWKLEKSLGVFSSVRQITLETLNKRKAEKKGKTK